LDPETSELLGKIHRTLQSQVKSTCLFLDCAPSSPGPVTDANTSYQKEVGAYLQRFDDYLRSEQGSRSSDWKQMTEAVAKLEAQVNALTLKTVEQNRRRSSEASRRKLSKSENGPERTRSILKRFNTPVASDDEVDAAKAERSGSNRRKRRQVPAIASSHY
jgi:hypothetical protein